MVVTIPSISYQTPWEVNIVYIIHIIHMLHLSLRFFFHYVSLPETILGSLFSFFPFLSYTSFISLVLYFFTQPCYLTASFHYAPKVFYIILKGKEGTDFVIQ